jgi:NAD(P)-dependent dehydrogenase (short-subunit alcohol dehydrogenase family)
MNTYTPATYPSLHGKRAFITGGATGIGASLVAGFAAQGVRLSFVDLAREAGQALADKLAQSGESVRFQHLDVTDTTALQSAIAESAAALGGLDILINNVANDQRHQTEGFSAEDWRRNLAVNLDPTFFAAQAARPFMSAAGGGAILNFSSINALLGPSDMPAYVTAKAGILGLTKALAREFGAERIRVNAILPGWVVTERQLHLWLSPEAEAAWAEMCCLKDRILPEDVTRLALFLCADDARMITAQAFQIDAGRC